jgi:DNA-binding transcriptional regulator YiaG
VRQEAAMKNSIAKEMVEGLGEFVEALKGGEVISERFTCHRIVLDLEPTPYGPTLVKQTRKTLGASRAVFAQFLGVATKTVCAWELGRNTPSDMACRFMDEIRRDPKYWVTRFRRLVKAKRVGIGT